MFRLLKCSVIIGLVYTGSLQISLAFAPHTAKGSNYQSLNVLSPFYTPVISTMQIGMFGGLFGVNKDKAKKAESNNTPPSAGKAPDAKKLQEMKSNLAKIGNTQKRDYEAEAKARAPPPPTIKDKQTTSFNFNKANEFPNLFKGTQGCRRYSYLETVEQTERE